MNTSGCLGDYYVRVHGNDYSVDPVAIGRMVEVRGSLERVRVYLDHRLIADHQRRWATHQTITDPAHRESAGRLRQQYWKHHNRGDEHDAGERVGIRSLLDYDTLFETTSDIDPETSATLESAS